MWNRTCFRTPPHNLPNWPMTCVTSSLRLGWVSAVIFDDGDKEDAWALDEDEDVSGVIGTVKSYRSKEFMVAIVVTWGSALSGQCGTHLSKEISDAQMAIQGYISSYSNSMLRSASIQTLAPETD